MSRRKAVLGLVVTGLVTVLTAGMAFAQVVGGAATTGGRPPRGDMRAAFMDNIKQQLGVTDDEWTVLQPKLEKVMTLSRELRPSPFGGGRQRGPRADRGGENAAPVQPTGDLAEKATALRTALDNKDSDPKDIAQKLAALRDARERVKADLIKAQGELKDLLTPRQEARLVLMGLLD
jgi:hypothetical protein